MPQAKIAVIGGDGGGFIESTRNQKSAIIRCKKTNLVTEDDGEGKRA